MYAQIQDYDSTVQSQTQQDIQKQQTQDQILRRQLFCAIQERNQEYPAESIQFYLLMMQFPQGSSSKQEYKQKVILDFQRSRKVVRERLEKRQKEDKEQGKVVFKWGESVFMASKKSQDKLIKNIDQVEELDPSQDSEKEVQQEKEIILPNETGNNDEKKEK